MTHVHVTKRGERIPVTELTDSHLRNIIEYIKRRASNGLTLKLDFLGVHPECEVVYDDEACELLDLDSYVDEWHRRNPIMKEVEDLKLAAEDVDWTEFEPSFVEEYISQIRRATSRLQALQGRSKS